MKFAWAMHLSPGQLICGDGEGDGDVPVLAQSAIVASRLIVKAAALIASLVSLDALYPMPGSIGRRRW
jgi:hypothetical protein